LKFLAKACKFKYNLEDREFEQILEETFFSVEVNRIKRRRGAMQRQFSGQLAS